MSMSLGLGVWIDGAGAGVAAPPSFTSQTVYEGQTLLSVNAADFYTITPTGYAVQSGSLPGGVTLNTSTGVISGAPSAAGSFSAVIRATDAGAATQDNTFAFTVNAWYADASAAWSPDSADVASGDVTTFDDLVADAVTLTYRATAAGGAAKATISGGVVSFTEAAEAAYVSATGSSQLGSGNAFGHLFSGFTTSSSSNNGIPILRGTSTVSQHYMRFDLDASAALQVDPLLRNSATLVAGRDGNEVGVLSQNDELHVSQYTDGDELWSFYQGLPINYDRTNTAGGVLAGTISDNLTAIIGHADTTSGRAFTGEFYGAAELHNGDSPTPAKFARVAGAIAGKSGNFTARPGIVVAGVGNSLGAGSSPPAATPETVSAARGFSVLDLSTDNTQYFTYDLRAPLSHFRAADWATSTAYVRGDYVLESGSVYYCLAGHTSGTFATDLGNTLWIAAASREANLSGWTDPGLKGADPASSSDGKNNIARADPQVYMLNQIVTDSDAFVIYAGAHASGACLSAETADDNGSIDYWLSASDAPGTPTQTSLWDAHVAKLQKVFEVADATPAMHTPFKVLAVAGLGAQEARGASNYAGGPNLITPTEYQTYLEAFVSRAFSALGVDMILYAPATVDLDYVDNADDGVFAEFQAIETAVAAADPRFVLGCPGHIDPGVNPEFTVDANGAWASSVPSGGTQIYIGTPGTGDQLHLTAAYHRAQGRYDAGLVLAEYRRQKHGA